MRGALTFETTLNANLVIGWLSQGAAQLVAAPPGEFLSIAERKAKDDSYSHLVEKQAKAISPPLDFRSDRHSLFLGKPSIR